VDVVVRDRKGNPVTDLRKDDFELFERGVRQDIADLTTAGVPRTWSSPSQLTNDQARRLRAEARERGISLAEVIRRYVDRGLATEVPHREALYERATRGVGRHRDRRGARDVG
jgi:hypothetical protein